MNINKKWHIIIGLVAAALLLHNPFTRQVILFLLPLGSGVDDFLEIAVLVVLAGILLSRWWVGFKARQAIRKYSKHKNVKKLQIGLTIAVIALLMIFPYTGQGVASLVLYGGGEQTNDLGFYLLVGIAVVAIVVIWNITKFLNERIRDLDA